MRLAADDAPVTVKHKATDWSTKVRTSLYYWDINAVICPNMKQQMFIVNTFLLQREEGEEKLR
jgi:hypothetical protein